MAKAKPTRNYADVIRRKLAANPKLARAVEKETFNAEIAQQVYKLRKQAGLTQRALAQAVGTQQSVISRIEDADYAGRSLAILQRIASAVGKRLKLSFTRSRAVGTLGAKSRTRKPTQAGVDSFSTELETRQSHGIVRRGRVRAGGAKAGKTKR